MDKHLIPRGVNRNPFWKFSLWILPWLAMLGIGVASIMAGLEYSGRVQTRQRDRFLALQFTKERIEQARQAFQNGGMAALNSGAFPDDRPGNPRFLRRISFTRMGDHMAEVQATVSYADGNVQLRTRFLKPPE